MIRHETSRAGTRYASRLDSPSMPASTSAQRRSYAFSADGDDREGAQRYAALRMGFVRRLHCVLTLIALAYGSLIIVACSQSDEQPCTPSRGVVVVAVPPLLAESRVSTKGQCGPAECVEPRDAGCVQWESAMPTKDPHDQCHVLVERPDGSIQQALVFGGQQCGQSARGSKSCLTDSITRLRGLADQPSAR